MHALHQEILPPSGVEFATSLKLTPSTLQPISPRHEIAARVLCNVVVARSNLLRIFEVRAETASQPEREREKAGKASKSKRGKGTDTVKSEAEKEAKTVTKFYHVKEHRLHGIVTGLEGVKVVGSLEDKLDRLLVSFKDAKIALLEWSEAVHDLVTVSIHTYERAPQLISLDTPVSFFHAHARAHLRVDPLSRCAALLLPKDAIAILPFHQNGMEQGELDVDTDVEMSGPRDVPYSPSFILDLSLSVSSNIRNVIDFVFLPGFNNPTIAVLFQPQQTWTGRLNEHKDTVCVTIFTLDILPQNFPIISSVSGLPHDSLSLLPCPSGGIGISGVILTTANSLVYIDQRNSKRVVLPVNGWAGRVSDMEMPMPAIPHSSASEDSVEGTNAMFLEASRAVFIDEKSFLLILKDGSVYPVEVEVDGKAVVGMRFVGGMIAQSTIPCIAKSIIGMGGSGASTSSGADEEVGASVFIGSTVGPSVLVRCVRTEEVVLDDDDNDVKMSNGGGGSGGLDVEMDEIDDEDIYGPSTSLTNKPDEQKERKTRSVIRLSLSDYLPAYGPVGDLVFGLGRNGDRPVPELIASTGSGSLGGFTLFQRDLPIRTKRKLHAIGGARGMWSLGVKMAQGGSPGEDDTMIISTDAIPSPGLSRISSRSPKNDISITTRIPGTTVGAGAFFQRTAILHVMTNAIRVMEPDGTERQIIKDMDGTTPRAKIRSCSISDPYVLIFREDDSIGLFIGEMERGKIRRKDMSPMGDKTSRYLTGCFFADSSGLFESNLDSGLVPPSAVSEKGAGAPTPQTMTRTQWLMLVRPQGVMEIWTLPKLALSFSVSTITALDNVLSDSYDMPALSLPQDPSRKPQEMDIDQILVAPLGQSAPEPHLFVFLRSGQLAIYQAVPTGTPSASLSEPTNIDNSAPSAPSQRTSHLRINFVKTLAKSFEIRSGIEEGMQVGGVSSIIAEQKRILRTFVPFRTAPSSQLLSSGSGKETETETETDPMTTYSGVFFTGENPSWILGTDRGGVRMFPSGHGVVHAFTQCSLWSSKGDFLVYSDEGPSLLEWIPEFQMELPLPMRSIPRGRTYSSVVFEPSTSLVVAAAALEARFASFDEDGNQLWEPDAPNISDPTTECSTVELISPDLWVSMDGYEFATNETVNAIACVTLETASTETGSKEFIAVGTIINRGEDLAAKGATYIFEIVEVVPDPALTPRRWYKLRLRCRDDAKGPVTALCGFNGYLVSSMGQKIFVRAFDSDERLVGVAFMDVGVYVTSLRTIKNLLLVGDAVKSVSFVAFQEDPYKLILLAKDVQHLCVNTADFFFSASDLESGGEGEMAIFTNDEEGIMRLYDFNPQDPDSRDGRYLLLRSEFNSQAEYHTTALIARRRSVDDVIPHAKLICGATNGSIACLTPVSEAAAKRLQLLQGQLTRNIQHVAGLNPRALRIVRNDYVSKPLSKGILDANLLRHYENASMTTQKEMTRQIGTEVGVMKADWIALDGCW